MTLSVSYHEAVCEMCRGGAWLEGFLGRSWHGPLVDRTQGHHWGCWRRHRTACVIVVVPQFVLTKLQ